MKRKISILAGILSAAIGVPLPAPAALITGVGTDVIDYNFSSVQGGVTLSGTVNVDVTAFNVSTRRVTLLVTLANTTPTSTAGKNRWTQWGFGVDPNLRWIFGITFNDDNDGGMTGASTSNFPSLPLLEACSTSGGNCSGGGNGGISENSSDSFTLKLWFGSSIADGVTLDPFGVKFQSAGPTEGSVEFYTPADAPPPPPPPPPGQLLPEPGTLALIGLGALGAGAIRRRRKLRDSQVEDD